jgi:DNA-binding response OmpR family regulator
MSAGRPILIIDDDSAIRALLIEHLMEDNEFHPVEAATLREADQRLGVQNTHYDTVILDIGLPDGDGHSYCAKLREQGHKMPIIMLTGAGDETDVVRGLHAGANDYIVKPFRLQELKARIRSQLRDFESTDAAVFTIGRYLFRPSARSLLEYASNRRIHLTLKEVELLKLLHRAGNRVVDRQELLNRVWGYNSQVTTHTLETHVYRLRQKIERDPTEPRLLVTHQKGYRLALDDVGAGEAWCAPHSQAPSSGARPVTELTAI